MSSKVNEFKIQLEKITFENKETTIMMDSLKESNQELSKEVEDLKFFFFFFIINKTFNMKYEI